MIRRWYCGRCGAETSDPLFKYDPDDGITGTPRYGCPRCGEWDIEELERCPDCDGWRHKSEPLCEKCQLRTRGALARDLRKYTPAALEYIQNLIDEGEVLDLI
jgi:DNA-directed RNA polymerase subunit RPC12/RpoP